jgi:hypothetical protein
MSIQKVEIVKNDVHVFNWHRIADTSSISTDGVGDEFLEFESSIQDGTFIMQANNCGEPCRIGFTEESKNMPLFQV